MDVVVYSSEYCGFCHRAKHLLQSMQIPFREINVDGKPDLRADMARKAGRSSVPQIWFGDDHIGGCDDLYRLAREDKLKARLQGASKKS